MSDEQILDTFLDGDASKLSPQDRKRLDEMIEAALRDPDEDYSGWEE